MALPIQISDIIEALEMQSDNIRAYLNIKTGEIVTVTDEELALNEGELFDTLDESTEENAEATQDILESEDFIQLPDKFDINEYGIMEEFCLSLTNDNLRETISNVIKGSGAFRRFKDNIRRFGIEEKWYRYRDQKMKEIAIEWCQENKVPFVE